MTESQAPRILKRASFHHIQARPLCVIRAVCSEKVSGEDYQGGGRCVESCESYGDEGVAIDERCVREALTCQAALECFD